MQLNCEPTPGKTNTPQEKVVNFSSLKCVTDGKLPQRYLDRLATLRSFPDEIPARIVRPWNHPNWPLMKCRKGAITAIRNSLARCVDSGFIKDESISSKIRDFLQHKFGDLTTRLDIKLMNDTLDAVIDYLCSTYQLEKPVIDYNALLQSQRAEFGLKKGELGRAPASGISD